MRNGVRCRPPPSEMTSERGPVLQRRAAKPRASSRSTGAGTAGRPRRGARASACPDGDYCVARATPSSACRFRAITGSPPPRVFRSNRGRDGVLKENTARPDIRQSERPVPRVLTGPGMPPKSCRIVFSIPGIERCLRKGFLSCSRPILP